MTDAETKVASGDSQTSDEPASLTFAEFLATVPPQVRRRVEDAKADFPNGYSRLIPPDIRLRCDRDECGGLRNFEPIGEVANFSKVLRTFLNYRCRNCRQSQKSFALYGVVLGKDMMLEKYGELPGFGPWTPPRLISLIGPDRDTFLKGRRAESQGLGIGAYAYYRRVVENQKNRILDEVIRVAEKTGAKPDVLHALSQARDETQFSKAVDQVKDAFPQSLLIDGHNPLSLLHTALSKGLHAQSDEECLASATSIRLVLDELSDRAAAALKDRAELKSALSRLMNAD